MLNFRLAESPRERSVLAAASRPSFSLLQMGRVNLLPGVRGSRLEEQSSSPVPTAPPARTRSP